jgi:hypothetical protein
MKLLAQIMTTKQLEDGQFRTSTWLQRNTTSAKSIGIGEMGRVAGDGVKNSD